MIPFVQALGDELERAIAARRGRIRRRIAIGGLGFAIAATGVAAASEIFGSPEQLATTSVGCYDRADMTAGVSVVSVIDGTPVDECRRVMRTSRPLVACADSAHVVVLPDTTCAKAGLRPLPAEYSAARAKVVALRRAIAALEGSADCIDPEELAEHVQQLLDESGWTGWRTKVRSDLASGPCGTVTTMGGDGRRYLEGSLDPREKLVLIIPEPPRELMDLLYAPDGIAGPTMDATGERCYTVERAQDLSRRRLAEAGRPVTFSIGSRPPETDIEGPRGDRLDEGCAIIVGIATTEGGGILVEIWR
jgi:hypothetical protein